MPEFSYKCFRDYIALYCNNIFQGNYDNWTEIHEAENNITK